MHIDTQFSIFMVNKPGVLSQVLREFAHQKINIIAISMMDSVEHGVMRVVGGSRVKIEKVLNDLNMPYKQTDVLCVRLSNKSGALADVTEKLSKSHINISYAYCTAGARGGKTTGILKVADVNKAMKVLKGIDGGSAKKTVKKSPRRSSSPRK